MPDSLGTDLGYMKQSVRAVVQLNERIVRLNAVHNALHHITDPEPSHALLFLRFPFLLLHLVFEEYQSLLLRIDRDDNGLRILTLLIFRFLHILCRQLRCRNECAYFL